VTSGTYHNGGLAMYNKGKLSAAFFMKTEVDAPLAIGTYFHRSLTIYDA